MQDRPLRDRLEDRPRQDGARDVGSPAITAEGLVKRYGEERALDGFDLAVAPGTICGLLGPNGAGKTTAVRILTTLLRPDGGRATVAGIDVVRDPHGVRQRIGLSGQSPAVDEILSGRQNLVMFGRLHHLSKADALRRADELLEQFGLADAAGKATKHYSGGMRRRLDLAATLILSPAVLFLDEPTTGLDPRNRNETWTAIRTLVAHGTTVLLTTQYLDEADQLADHIVVIDAGRAIATGTPDDLKAQVGGDRLDVVIADPADLGRTAGTLPSCNGVAGASEVDVDLRRVSVPVRDRVAALTDALRALELAGIRVADASVRRPTLDDAFLHLTGHTTAGSASAGAVTEGDIEGDTDRDHPTEEMIHA